ncbi:Polyketide biosynthesis 3-hydroxy-3-methylglutaryl-ACP synthase PksG [compost metagenome]
MDEYDALLYSNQRVSFGTKNVELDLSLFPQIHAGSRAPQRLVLKRINQFHREYEWV